MALSGANLAPFSAIWRHLAPLGAIYLALKEMAPRGATWRQMAPIIQNLGKSPIGANWRQFCFRTVANWRVCYD